MKTLNEEIKKMRSLIKSKHGLIMPLVEQKTEDKEKDNKKEEEEERKKELEITKKRKEEEERKKEIKKTQEPKKEDETLVLKNLEDELYDVDCDMEIVREMDDFLDDNFINIEDINKIKKFVIDIVKSCE